MTLRRFVIPNEVRDLLRTEPLPSLDKISATGRYYAAVLFPKCRSVVIPPTRRHHETLGGIMAISHLTLRQAVVDGANFLVRVGAISMSHHGNFSVRV